MDLETATRKIFRVVPPERVAVYSHDEVSGPTTDVGSTMAPTD